MVTYCNHPRTDKFHSNPPTTDNANLGGPIPQGQTLQNHPWWGTLIKLNVNMCVSLCPNSLNISLLPPDASQHWAPENSDQANEGLPKAKAVHVPPLRTVSCDSWKRHRHICVHFDATSGAANG